MRLRAGLRLRLRSARTVGRSWTGTLFLRKSLMGSKHILQFGSRAMLFGISRAIYTAEVLLEPRYSFSQSGGKEKSGSNQNTIIDGEPVMDLLKNEISALVYKVDALYETIDQLNSKIAVLLSERGLANNEIVESSKYEWRRDRSLGQRDSLEASLVHKDILVEPNYLDGKVQYGETEITPDIQIQRLTAQLTAAYNRIAALEEQLLAQRIQ